jgi:protein involved in polysaccharide export with SLBB domain
MKHTITIQIVGLFTLLFATLAGCASQQSNIATEAAALPASMTRSSEPAPYLIQPGDTLDIKFFYNPELNETVTVRPDGKISLQLVDEVQAAGIKPSQLDDELTEKYARELKKPAIAVIVKSFGGQRIFVGGEVNKQGLIAITSNMTPLQAVFNAGGFKETASPESAIIIRKGPGNKPVPIAMNLNDAMQGKNGSANFLLQPDDIVYVPKSAIAKANKFVDQYIENLLLFRGVSMGFSYEVHSDGN